MFPRQQKIKFLVVSSFPNPDLTFIDPFSPRDSYWLLVYLILCSRHLVWLSAWLGYAGCCFFWLSLGVTLNCGNILCTLSGDLFNIQQWLFNTARNIYCFFPSWKLIRYLKGRMILFWSSLLSWSEAKLIQKETKTFWILCRKIY